MKKTTKIFVSCLLVLTMIFSVGMVAFAGEISNEYGDGKIRSSAVVFQKATDGKLVVSAFVRNQGVAKEATLICAIYSDGKMLDIAHKADGSNKVLKLTGIEAEGKILKAFVWDNTNMQIISEIATYDGTDVFSNLKITVDGIDFAEYVDEESVDLSVSSNYTKSFVVGSAKFPKDIKVIGDNGIVATVVTDEKAVPPVTKITVGYGLSSVETSGEISYWVNSGVVQNKKVQLETLKMDEERVYTITYKEVTDKNKIYESYITKISAPISAAGEYKWIYKKTYTGGTAENPELVSVNLNNDQGRGALIIVQPKDGYANTIPFDELIVGEDGTKFATKDDMGGTGYIDESGNFALKDIPKQKGSGKISANGKIDNNYVVVENFHSYNGNVYGSRPGHNQNPASGNQMCVEDTAISGDVSTEFTGEFAPMNHGQYIPLAWSANSVGEVKFYVDRPADVYVIDTTYGKVKQNGAYVRIATLTEADGWSYKEIAKPHIRETYQDSYSFRISYTDGGATKKIDVHSPLPMAYALSKGTISEDDLKYIFTLKHNNANLWRFHGHDLARKVGKLEYTNANGYYDTTVLDDIVVFNWWTDLSALEDYTGKFSNAVAGFTSGSLIKDGKVKTLGNSTKATQIALFDVTPGVTDENNKNMTPDAYGKFAIYSDRSNGVGILKQYNPVLELKGAEVIKTTIDLSNGVATDWNTEKKAYYEFEVTDDSEVMVFVTAAKYSDIAREKGEADWSEVNLDYNGITVTTDGNVSYSNLAVKEYKKGEKVTIYSPGNASRYVIIVKPIN